MSSYRVVITRAGQTYRGKPLARGAELKMERADALRLADAGAAVVYVPVLRVGPDRATRIVGSGSLAVEELELGAARAAARRGEVIIPGEPSPSVRVGPAPRRPA